MGTAKGNIAVGALVKYIELDHKGMPVYGIVVEYCSYFEDYKEAAVKVEWFDDWAYTYEIVSQLLSTLEEYSCMEIISEV